MLRDSFFLVEAFLYIEVKCQMSSFKDGSKIIITHIFVVLFAQFYNFSNIFSPAKIVKDRQKIYGMLWLTMLQANQISGFLNQLYRKKINESTWFLTCRYRFKKWMVFKDITSINTLLKLQTRNTTLFSKVTIWGRTKFGYYWMFPLFCWRKMSGIYFCFIVRERR